MTHMLSPKFSGGEPAPVAGLAGWLLTRWRREVRPPRRLRVMERVTLGPRQTVSLIEADGQRFLVAISPDGSPAIQRLGARTRPAGRTSW